MNEEAFNISIRKFLKMVGVNSQRAIEQAVDKALADGTIKGTESFPARVTLEVARLQLNVKFDGEIKLQQIQLGVFLYACGIGIQEQDTGMNNDCTRTCLQ